MTVTVTELRAGRRRDGGPVADGAPALSWIVAVDGAGWLQRSAELVLQRGGGIPPESHTHLDDESVGVAWPFAPLAAGELATLRVRVEGTDGQWSPWSAELPIEAGFLAEGHWRARFVGHPNPTGPAAPVLVRRGFTVDRPVVRARLAATAQGVYRATINSREVDDAVLKPGWTAYHERLVHEWSDVTALIQPGANVLEFEVAGGWFTEEYGFSGHARRVYGEQPVVAGQVLLHFADGSVETVATDADCVASSGGITRSSSIYHGEHADARERHPSDWVPAAVHGATIVPGPASAEPVRPIEERPVERVITTPSGRTVLDFGQNLVGVLRIRVAGPAGTTITLRHAEVLEHGELGVRPLREARATDSYVLSGDGMEIWQPRFTFHGFRYAEVDGWPGPLDPSDVTAIVLHSDLRRTGWFSSSSEQLDRLHENIVWSMRGNFLSLPTDCPQRDERLGWTGDIQVFAPTAAFLFDCDAFLSSWLTDLRVEQRRAGGIVPFVVPDVFPGAPVAAAAWGDAATVVPSVLFERYADRPTLDAQLGSMRAWSDHLAELAGPSLIWKGGFQFGDWLDPDAPPEFPDEAKTHPDIVATAYLYRSTALTATAAERLNRNDDARAYRERAERIRAAFLRQFVSPAGRMSSDSPTAYALAIVFGIVGDDLQGSMGDRLAELVRGAAYHLGTGFVGTPIVLDALTLTGHADAAGRLLLQTGNPSWLYAVTMGATTTWERWDSMLEDGSINPGEMTSFNHYAFGAVADWLHRRLAGLAPSAPGYRRLAVAPVVLDGLDSARAGHDTPYGRAEAGWRRLSASEVEVELLVPANSTASVRLPDGATHEVGSGAHRWIAGVAGAVGQTLTLDSPVRALVDDAAALGRVRELLATRGPAWTHFRRQLQRSPDTTVRQTLDALILAPGLDTAVESVLNP